MIVNQSKANIKYENPDGTFGEAEYISNNVYSYFIDDNVSLIKTSDKTYLSCGDMATQTVVINNASDITLTDIIFKDVLTGPAEYVEGSVVINSVSKPDYDLVTGFPLDDLAAKGSVEIKYNINALTEWETNIVTNKAEITYNIIDPIAGEEEFTSYSNLLELEFACLRMSVVKSVDKTYVQSGDILTYTSIITNSGNVSTSELIFTDIIPEGTTYIENSLYMDGLPLKDKNPSDGVNIANLGSGQKTTLVFKVTVN